MKVQLSPFAVIGLGLLVILCKVAFWASVVGLGIWMAK